MAVSVIYLVGFLEKFAVTLFLGTKFTVDVAKVDMMKLESMTFGSKLVK